MLKKILTVVYVLLLCFVAVLALTIGVSNSAVAEFNVLFFKTQMTVSTISAISLLAGVLLCALVFGWIIIKLWFRCYSYKLSLRKLEKKYSECMDELEDTQDKLLLDYGEQKKD
ncbi:lipopolysaccharide assembly protein LapA domain-containing protein [uncultured Ruminobacter sp.]|jgi:uncharacterized membrane protein YciS (DUF1049 family)|uniref:lipopolysaccharide assembly protein LapA domain-containing protein n=1 Tax=Ruminobacter sp. TaxID=2774296 RepID=UPI0025E5338A|nr:lipopolysaccharide assembly protein LapA domain-containing protein [uncultured Ruminobacter sp.]